MITNPQDYLFVSDLDGTLLEPGGHFPDALAERLNRLIERGLNFTIATARTYDSAHPLLKKVNLTHPAILFNGVFLTEFHTGHNILETDFIQHDVVHGVMDLLRPNQMDPFVYTYGEESRVMHGKADNPGAQRYLDSLETDRRLCQVEDYHFVNGERIAGFLVIDRPEKLTPIHDHLKTTYPHDLNLYFAEDISDPGFYWLQAFHAEANKGSMVRRLAEHSGFPLEKIVVFGDYLNDLEMFKVAGKALAVGNALDTVLEAADAIIAPNSEQGVIRYLESLGF